MNNRMNTAATVLAMVIPTVGLVLLYFYLKVGLIPMVGLAGALIVSFVLWRSSYLETPTDPAVLLPLFLVCLAGFEINLVEQALMNYGPAMSRVLGVGFSSAAFVVSSLALCAGLSLVAFGLTRRHPIAGFVAIVFLVTRVLQFGLFVFPLFPPSIQPDVNAAVSQMIAGIYVENMPNHHISATGHYYFPGIYTVALAIVPAMYTVYRIWAAAHSQNRQYAALDAHERNA